VYVGNEAAATAADAFFTHLLCVDDDLEQPDHVAAADGEVTFVKVPLRFGVDVPLDEVLLREAVWQVRNVWKKHLRAPGPSILIYCRYEAQFRCSDFTTTTIIIYRVAQNVSRYHESSLNRIKARH